MPITFDEAYFNGGHYHPYQDFSHFVDRAAWINSFMNANGYNHVTILGAAYGYVIKYLVENHGFDNTTVLGIENSDYAISQANSLGYGVTQGYIIKGDIRTHVYDDSDLVISWNVLDCLDDLTQINNAIIQINNIDTCQIHVYGASDDPSISQYNLDGYFFASFFDVFSAMEMSPRDDSSYLIRSHDGYVYRVIRSGGSKLGTPYLDQGFDIPLVGWSLTGGISQ